MLKRFSRCFHIAEDTTTLKLEDDLNAEETSSEDEDELPQEGRGLKDLWERDEEKESWDEDEAENEDEDEDTDEHAHEGDEDRDEMKRTSALLLQG